MDTFDQITSFLALTVLQCGRRYFQKQLLVARTTPNPAPRSESDTSTRNVAGTPLT